uniref:Putative nuclease HARBI1 n=1 Tax=Lygus hesperus TaxID=30085 RepID=A0A0A9WTT4_LYGHE
MEYLEYLDYEPNGTRRHRDDNASNPLDDLSDGEFKDRYRLSKESVGMLVEMLAEYMESMDPRAPHTVPLWKKVLVALRFFAEGTLHRETGDLLGVSEATACRCVHQVAETIEKSEEEIHCIPDKGICYPEESEIL